jgi:hypothetical protein
MYQTVLPDINAAASQVAHESACPLPCAYAGFRAITGNPAVSAVSGSCDMSSRIRYRRISFWIANPHRAHMNLLELRPGPEGKTARALLQITRIGHLMPYAYCVRA